MIRIAHKRGSALLIVLGMLSFMIVSAVGFAAYMRYSRLPSSYLRRTSSSRMLVKAAVAEGINALDLAVNNNPHPGIGTKWVSADRQSNGDDTNRTSNLWHHRVLIGTNMAEIAQLRTACTKTPSDLSYETVSTLTLESLAYIPPPLVNDVRFFSRISPTAVWKSFDFDAGRYAYTVVDVSDFFDVNRLLADAPRSSAANRRIVLSHLFEEGARHNSPPSNAAAWDEFMKNFRTIDENTLKLDFKGGKYPLVSVADLNLALGSKGSAGGFESPFYEFVDSGGSGSGFYNTTSETDEDRIRRMVFVTDGLFPTNAASAASSSSSGNGSGKNQDVAAVLELSDGQNQPWDLSMLDDRSGSAPSLSAVMGSMRNADLWRKRLSRVGCMALFDYLDTDNVPLSLALPLAERVPMVCAVEPEFPGAKFGVVKSFDPAGNGENDTSDGSLQIVSATKTSRTVRRTVYYNVDNQNFLAGFMGGRLGAVVAYPFLHPVQSEEGTFKVDGRFGLFLSSEKMNLRTGNRSNNVLALAKNVPESGMDDNGFIGVKLEDWTVPLPKNTTSQKDALKKNTFSLQGGTAAGPRLGQKDGALLRVTYEWQQTVKNNAGGMISNPVWEPAFKDIDKTDTKLIIEAKCGVGVVKADGTADGDFKSNDVSGLFGKTMRLNMTVCLRVKNADGKVVDMAPADANDDSVQNNAQTIGYLGPYAPMACGKFGPLMLFNTGVDFEFSPAGLDALAASPAEISVSPKAAIAPDPRFNHAPEQWFALNGSVDEQKWLDNNHSGDNGCDGDIFMGTSDAGYMQSIYELAMIPRFTDLKNYGADDTIGNMGDMSAPNLDAIPSDFGSCLNKGMMWRTYDLMDRDLDACYTLPWTSEGTGFKITPYSDCTNVMMAAFANTPLSWRHSSTNIVQKMEDFASMDAKRFNEKYAFNAYSQGTKLSWNFLNGVAGALMSGVRAHPDREWTEAFEDLDWYGDTDKFCGVEFDSNCGELWAADRKFLYGFWRECFAARQQLFLVFARAEPTMMGGESGKRLPPQLGARAMAVVWRDPTSNGKDEKAPHRTRVLFYRQFD